MAALVVAEVASSSSASSSDDASYTDAAIPLLQFVSTLLSLGLMACQLAAGGRGVPGAAVRFLRSLCRPSSTTSSAPSSSVEEPMWEPVGSRRSVSDAAGGGSPMLVVTLLDGAGDDACERAALGVVEKKFAAAAATGSVGGGVISDDSDIELSSVPSFPNVDLVGAAKTHASGICEDDVDLLLGFGGHVPSKGKAVPVRAATAPRQSGDNGDVDDLDVLLSPSASSLTKRSRNQRNKKSIGAKERLKAEEENVRAANTASAAGGANTEDSGSQNREETAEEATTRISWEKQMIARRARSINSGFCVGLLTQQSSSSVQQDLLVRASHRTDEVPRQPPFL